MTRADYRLVSKVLGGLYARHGQPSERTMISRVASALSVAFQKDNPGFQPELFAAAIAREEQDAVDARIIAQQFDLARSERMGARTEKP